VSTVSSFLLRTSRLTIYISQRLWHRKLVGNESVPSIIPKLKELLLQETIGPDDLPNSYSEVVTCGCDELIYGQSSESRGITWSIFFNLFNLPKSNREFRRLGEEGGVIDRIAQKLQNL